MAIDFSQMTENDARALFLNRVKRVQNFDGSLPDLEQLDGQLALKELSASAVTHAEKLAETGPNNETDGAMLVASLVTKSLVLRSTSNRIFKDTDIQAVADMGLAVVMQLGAEVKKISGIGQDAVIDAKKNSPTVTDSATPSIETLPQEPQASV